VAREPWYESDNPTRVARGASWRIGVWIVVVVAFCALLGAGIWAVKVATSDVRGRGYAVNKVNAADNRLFAQGNFHDLHNEVIASDQKLDQAAADIKAHPGDTWWQTNYTGLLNHCIDTRNQYNAAAKKITQAKFRDEELPYQLDESDPRFDCKETPK
jgi:hypothetical protein